MQPSERVYEIEPGQTRTIEIDAAHGFTKIDEDGASRMSVWAGGDDHVKVRFVGPDCALQASSTD